MSSTKLSFIDNVQSPRLYYRDSVKVRIDYLVKKCPKEVGWLGLVEEIEDTNCYVVTDIFVPEQEVHGTETDIKPKALIDLHEELLALNKDPNNLRYWGHSHVNMGVSPSGQDIDQVMDYKEGGMEFFFMGIYNKKGESNVEFFDFANNIRHAGIWDGRFIDPLTAKEMEFLDKLIKTNVQERVYAYNTYNNNYSKNYNRNNNYNRNLPINKNQRDFSFSDRDMGIVSATPPKAKRKGKKKEQASDKSQAVKVKQYNSENEVTGLKDMYWDENLGFYEAR